MSGYPSLTRALAEALVDVLWFVEGCEDKQLDPDDAVKVNDPSRRGFLLGFPEEFGLVEEDA